MGVERGEGRRQHGPFTASAGRKMQAVKWGWGYALAVSRTRCSVLHDAPLSRDPHLTCWAPALQRTTPQRAARCAASGARSLLSRAQRVGILDHIGAAT